MLTDIVLFSGGMDSTAILLGQDPKTTLAVFFNYGQPHRCPERRCASRMAKAHGYTLETHQIRGLSGGICDGPGISPVVPGRNAVFLSLASSIAASRGASRVWIGCAADDRDVFPDCRSAFIRAFNEMNRASGISVQVVAPLIISSKRDIADLIRIRGGDPCETWSCYHPVSQMPNSNHAQPCGACGACKAREGVS